MSLMPHLVVELIGTFVLLSVILSTSAQPLAAGIAFATALYFGAAANPATSLMPLISGQMGGLQTVMVLLMQCLAAACAVYFYKWTH